MSGEVGRIGITPSGEYRVPHLAFDKTAPGQPDPRQAEADDAEVLAKVLALPSRLVSERNRHQAQFLLASDWLAAREAAAEARGAAAVLSEEP